MKAKFLIILLVTGFCSLNAQKPAFPLHVGETGRYLVDSNQKPFFYQAETPWLIFINLNPEDMSKLMDIRVSQGFTVIQTMALTTEKNVNGDKPFVDNDLSKPNTSYFEYLRKGIKLAGEKGLFVGLSTVWKGCCGGDWNDILTQNGPEKCRKYGQFLGKFFVDCPNLYWIQGGDNDPREHIDHYREIALGIRESIPGALQTYHASSGHSSTDMVNYLDNSWLNFSWTYTYFQLKHNVWIYISGWGELPEVYEMNQIEYRKYPPKPFVLGESQYEGEDSASCKPFKASEIVRRQAYWSLLSGSCGHAYGSWNWKVDKNWRNVEKDSGAWDMLHLRELFTSIDWTKLQPDIDRQFISEGTGTFGKTDYATAAISSDKQFAMIYLPPSVNEKRTLSLNMDLFKNPVKLSWFDPTTGKYISISNQSAPNKGKYKITSPGKNDEGSNDWVLLIN